VITDRRPSRAKARDEYDASSRLADIRVPGSDSVPTAIDRIEEARVSAERNAIGDVCEQLLHQFSEFYRVPVPTLKMLGVRPHRTSEGRLASEILGDYDFRAVRIRLWTRTPMQHQWTSARTILSTLCHEFMHHLDASQLGFPSSYHTTGFFERTHRLYLGITGQPHYALAWFQPGKDGSRAIDWPETNRRKRDADWRRAAASEVARTLPGLLDAALEREEDPNLRR
jgi:hypothetical protein